MTESAAAARAGVAYRMVAAADPAARPRGFDVVERSWEVPVVGSVADIAGCVHLPLLTAVDVPSGSVLELDGVRVPGIPWKSLRADLASMSETAQGFVTYLTPEQVASVPAVFDQHAYDTVRLELPPGSAHTSVSVRGLNQLVTGKVYAGELRERYC